MDLPNQIVSRVYRQRQRDSETTEPKGIIFRSFTHRTAQGLQAEVKNN